MYNFSLKENVTNAHYLDLVSALDGSLVLVYLIAIIWFVFTITMYLKRSDSLSMKTLFSLKTNKSLLKMIIFSGLFCILYLLLQLLFLLIPFLPELTDYNSICDTVADIRFVLFMMTQLMIYLYLWMRMKLCYKTYAKINGRSGCFVALIWICLGFLLLSFATVLISSPFGTFYVFENKKCIYIHEEEVATQVFGFVIIALVILSQTSILMLITSVLLKQKNNIRSQNPESGILRQQADRVSRNRLYLTLKKLVVCSSLSIVTDVLMTVVNVCVRKTTSTESDFAFEISTKLSAIFINYFLTIMTYSEPRNIFLAPCKKHDNVVVTSTTNDETRVFRDAETGWA